MFEKTPLLLLCALAIAAALAFPCVALADGGDEASSLVAGDSAAIEADGEPAPLVTKHVADGVYYLKVAKAPSVALADPGASTAKGTQMRSAKAKGSASQKFYVRNEGAGLVSLQVVASGLFLGDRGDGRVVQLSDASSSKMRWRFASDKGLKLVNASSGAVLSLAKGKAAAGAGAVTAADERGASQRWKLVSAKLVANGYYRVKSATGNYLDVGDASCRYDANVQTWSGNSSGAQHFHIYEKSRGYYSIENSKSFLVLDVKKGSTANRANVIQTKNSSKSHALWKPVLDRSGKVVFVNKKSGKALEVANSSKERGANVRQNRLTGATGQLWTLEKTKRYSLSGNRKLDQRVAGVLHSIGNLRDAYFWTVRHPYREGQRYYSNPHVLPDSRTISLANDFLSHGSGNCYRFASTFSWLARGLGYKTRVISGWVQAAGGGRAPHGWVEVIEGSRTYVCDPDLQKELPAYNWYMRTYATSPTAYHSW